MTDTTSDLATLEFFARRVEALSLSIAAWTPCTGAGDEAHYAMTNLMDEAASAVRAAEDKIAEQEGGRL